MSFDTVGGHFSVFQADLSLVIIKRKSLVNGESKRIYKPLLMPRISFPPLFSL
jgi:hypothetical protein